MYGDKSLKISNFKQFSNLVSVWLEFHSTQDVSSWFWNFVHKTYMFIYFQFVLLTKSVKLVFIRFLWDHLHKSFSFFYNYLWLRKKFFWTTYLEQIQKNLDEKYFFQSLILYTKSFRTTQIKYKRLIYCNIYFISFKVIPIESYIHIPTFFHLSIIPDFLVDI